MAEPQLDTTVAFVIFNRPDTTRRVFDAIRGARPPRLLVVADGPRHDRPGDPERCAAARAVIDGVDWPCEVLRNFSDVNLGCKRRVSSGLDWVFENAEEAIILEDDCQPHPTFFRFCQELLARYRHDERIGMISGINLQRGRRRTGYSYYFSIYPHIWGWASWRRVWALYDRDIGVWPEIRDGRWFLDMFGDRATARHWTRVIEDAHANRIDTWDLQLALALWVNSGLTIMPGVNLVSNIGFGSGGTHTQKWNVFANMPVTTMDFPLRHPPYVMQDVEADRFEFDTHHNPGLLTKAGTVLKRCIRTPGRR